jgi:hypothetical protein
MGVVRGLKNIVGHNEAEEARFQSSQGPKTVWFKIADKQTVKVAFLQELDEDSPNFSSKNDLGILAVEHSNPDFYQRKALCTADEGGCWACEQHRKDYKAGWKGRSRLYINVLVDNGTDAPFVAVLSQGTSGKSITPTLIEYATDDGTITDKWFSIKRLGTGTDTSYSIRGLKEHGLNVEDYDVFDLSNVVRNIPYAEQEAHYLQGVETSVSEPEAAKVPVSAGAVDAEW